MAKLKVVFMDIETSSLYFIKGSNELYNVAIWKDDNFSYALQLEMAMSEKDLNLIIESIK